MKITHNNKNASLYDTNGCPISFNQKDPAKNDPIAKVLNHDYNQSFDYLRSPFSTKIKMDEKKDFSMSLRKIFSD